MSHKQIPDLCVLTYSEMNYDARSYNLVEFYRKSGLKVQTYSLSLNNTDNHFDIYLKVKKHKRFFVNWINFIFNGWKNRRKLKSQLYLAADLYSLVLLRLLCISPSRIIYDSREIFSALGTLENQSLKQKILTLIEKFSVHNVQRVMVSGELDAEYLEDYFKDEKKKYFVIKNLPKDIEIKQARYLREKYDIPSEKKILIYQGVILKGRGILPIIQALEFTDEYVFVIVGEGNYKNDLEKIVEQKKLQNKVYFHPQVNYFELFNITSSADIGMCLIEPITLSYELALPNKLFEYVYCGLPVLITDLPAMRKFVEENGVGEIIPKLNKPQEIINGLNIIKENISEYKERVARIKKELNYQSQSETLHEIIKI